MLIFLALRTRAVDHLPITWGTRTTPVCRFPGTEPSHQPSRVDGHLGWLVGWVSAALVRIPTSFTNIR